MFEPLGWSVTGCGSGRSERWREKGFELGSSEHFLPRASFPDFHPIAHRLDTSRGKTYPGVWYARLAYAVEGTVVARGACILLPLLWLWQPLDLLEVFDMLAARGGLCYSNAQHVSGEPWI